MVQMMMVMAIVQLVQTMIDPREQMQILQFLSVRTIVGAIQFDHLVRVRPDRLGRRTGRLSSRLARLIDCVGLSTGRLINCSKFAGRHRVACEFAAFTDI